LDKNIERENSLTAIGLLNNVREIFHDSGKKAAFSNICSSYHLLSKVYHPDKNPQQVQKAKNLEQQINKVETKLHEINDTDLDLNNSYICDQHDIDN
jgi:hypothetical protein